MAIDTKISYWTQTTQAAPLAVFRVLFGLLMCVSMIRFWWNGWIEKLYLQPQFFFSYYGFEWVKPLGAYTYLIFLICGISAFFVALGYKYRIAIVVFFLSFTYIELMDKTTYLNHYYFVSLVSFLLIFLPAQVTASIDAVKHPQLAYSHVPRWTIDSLKLMMGIVYFYAGLAKLNSDWLLNAMPLKIWLPGSYDLPLLGYWLQQTWVHYAMSWVGVLYDLSVPFLLLFAPTRWLGYALVVVFHLLTRLLFPIGMFPYLMIACTLIFFSPQLHERLLAWGGHWLHWLKPNTESNRIWALDQNSFWLKVKVNLVIVFFALQLTIPFRYLCYPGELFWTEEGFRFSWRVMLMEKAGATNFKIVNRDTGHRFYVDNQEFLSPFQEKQMSFQPDFILEYAHFLKAYFEAKGIENVEVYAESFVALNGRKSQPYIDPTVDLGREKESFRSKHWILPFGDEIKGL
ncbi:HTTM domain-containing protein [Reichenbachiella carrageenanivorans]|uniref:HTTM domain-containing protein n=1 Tax=Reichenbachiella carrageenanivorans TaxID=2979869 RepID=A0ABY6CXD1_9BACT|nr:HTTM domain-containing protein [Reichenbachiella carrageenanivorans]UXX78565.1 HTTM domain-containing protein [Reichenbachiella carrageenanivorans]